MKNNIKKILFLFSILFVSGIAYSSGKDVSKNIKKPLKVIKNTAGSITLDTTYNSKGQNFRERFIIVHYTALDKNRSLEVLTTQEVSSHFLISDVESDPVYALVDESRRAWHAGVSEWKTSKNLNDSSIGIEIVNPGYIVEGEFIPYKEFQIEKLAVLLKYLSEKYEIPPTNILGHADIAPQRKQDPGPLMPWKELYAKHNIGMWYDDDIKEAFKNEFSSIFSTLSVSDIQKELKKFGYAVDITNQWDKQTQNVIKAFQYHFRPELFDGKMDLETFSILKALNEKYK
ncbi:MAG: N-acetylmuramoyl-L-alanine amidase [Leptotrichiaceae bacterium]|nr:N-acetylmuramoyl-L-alanine amidase [Leptotrichiaceae bacterium]